MIPNLLFEIFGEVPQGLTATSLIWYGNQGWCQGMARKAIAPHQKVENIFSIRVSPLMQKIAGTTPGQHILTASPSKCAKLAMPLQTVTKVGHQKAIPVCIKKFDRISRDARAIVEQRGLTRTKLAPTSKSSSFRHCLA